MEFVVAAVISVVALAGAVVVAARSQVHAAQGWQVAEASQREVRQLLMARVTTLENRVDARSWAEFHDLQQVPDELAKAGYAEQAHAQSDPAWLQRVADDRDQGALLEDEDQFEGGSIIG